MPTSSGAKLIAGAVATVAVCGIGWLFWEHVYSPGEAIANALNKRLAGLGRSSDTARLQLLISTVTESYAEVRLDATRWSAVFWGFTFASLVASALAGVILKVESFQISDVKRRDLAAALAFVASIAAAISTTGEFKQRWRANRNAAAEIESLGYRILATNSPDLDTAFKDLGDIQFRRTQQITGIEVAPSDSKRSPVSAPAVAAREPPASSASAPGS